MRLLGILLVIFGVVLLVYGGITFFVPSDVIDLGNFTIAIHEDMSIPLPPIVGLVCLVLGIVMMMSAPVAAPPPGPPPQY